jgi:hypothetical protein
LNCCKRTPGNDLVITNGCGANNVCVGFNDHDQCNVNQHALHCNPCCPEGNIAFTPEGNIVKENGRVVLIAGACPNCDNDQGNPNLGLPAIYPLDYCLTENIKWKSRPNNNKDELDLPAMDLMTRSEAAAKTVLKSSTSQCVESAKVAEPRECDTADQCWSKYPDMFCPQCLEDAGLCVDIGDDASLDDVALFSSSVQGNLNCCKRTPGTSGIITNGCGANNVCIGFNQLDQCEVNDKAAYCNPYCPDGNVLFQTVKNGTPGTPKPLNGTPDNGFKWKYGADGASRVFALDSKGDVMFDPDGCPGLANNNGADNTGVAKPMVRIYPMTWCKCSDVKWKDRAGKQIDEVEASCGMATVGFGVDDAVTVVPPPTTAPTDAPRPTRVPAPAPARRGRPSPNSNIILISGEI